MSPHISRRRLLQSASIAAAGTVAGFNPLSHLWAEGGSSTAPLTEFAYGDVLLSSPLHETQLQETVSVLMGLSDDSLLKPYREMAGMPAPGEELGGWYLYNPDYDYKKQDAGLAPGATFGQWVSALARYSAITGSNDAREKVFRLNRLYAKTISADFYTKNRFPAYCYDKLVCGLIDSHEFVHDPEAFAILEQTTNTALPHLPGKAIDREVSWRPEKDLSFQWDESYTMPENLYLAYKRGAGKRYLEMANQYLDDRTYFDPLARGENVLGGKHAYSYVNALSSAMQAYMTAGSEKHLRAARNAFTMLTTQSYATGGWGPDELLRAPGSEDVFVSLTKTHNSFETPCGSYAHFKLTRYLLRVTRDSRYGDSMERVMYNTVLGAKPLEDDGHAFYYSDYNYKGRRVYSNHGWPCCSGTLPQVAADYRINTYFRDGGDVFVNLYIPSTLRWTQAGSQLSLTQESFYPFDEKVHFEITAAQPGTFALNLRIPQWAEGAAVSVNGAAQPGVTAGAFFAVRREWKTGDRIEVNLPMTMRTEAIDPRHTETVALLRGPVVLFAVGENKPGISRRQLLAARRVAQQEWVADSAGSPVKLLPFTAVGGEPYSTYLDVS